MKVNDFFLNINTENVDKLHAFYHDVVGLEPRGDMGPHALQLGSGALTFDGHIDTKGKVGEPSRWILSLMVDDAKAERERLEAAGVPFIRKEGIEPWGGKISTFTDPDGNLCQVVSFHPELAQTEG